VVATHPPPQQRSNASVAAARLTRLEHNPMKVGEKIFAGTPFALL
jgi:hypothetical protein